MGGRGVPSVRPGHTPRACFARTRPFRWSERGRVGSRLRGNDVGERRNDGGRRRSDGGRRRNDDWGCGDEGGGECDSGPASPPRAYPAKIASLLRAPFAEAKGAGWVPACAGMTWGSAGMTVGR